MFIPISVEDLFQGVALEPTPVKPTDLSTHEPILARLFAKLALDASKPRRITSSNTSDCSDIPSLVSDESGLSSDRAVCDGDETKPKRPSTFLEPAPFSHPSAPPVAATSQASANEPFACQGFPSLPTPSSIVGGVRRSLYLSSVSGWLSTASRVARTFPGPISFVQIDETGDPVIFRLDSSLRPLGSGGCSSVYLATFHTLADVCTRPCVVKISTNSSSAPLSMELESVILQMADQDEHMPFVAKGSALCIPGCGDYVYQPMKLYVGGSLATYIETQRPPEAIILRWMAQLLCGLQWLHWHSIVHCDLKPQNVLLDERGRMVICDFGLSQRLAGTESLSDWRFQETPFPFPGGTPLYFAPESHRAEKDSSFVTAAIDIYGLALIWLEMWAGISVVARLHEATLRGPVEHAKMENLIINLYIPTRSETGEDLLPLKSLFYQMLKYNADERPTVMNIMWSDYFHNLDWNQIHEATFTMEAPPTPIDRRFSPWTAPLT